MAAGGSWRLLFGQPAPKGKRGRAAVRELLTKHSALGRQRKLAAFCLGSLRQMDIAACILLRYTLQVIRSFRPEVSSGSLKMDPKPAFSQSTRTGWRKQLFALDNARTPIDMDAPGWRLHSLRGEFEGHWSIDVSGNWRLTFAFEGEDAILVDYQDYH